MDLAEEDKKVLEKQRILYMEKQFLCCTPINQFKWLSFTNENKHVQKEIVRVTVQNELVKRYSIRLSYIRAFLKALINELETSNVEVDEVVYKTYCDMIASKDDSVHMHYKHFLLTHQGKVDYLVIKESTNMISQGTTGLCVWNAAYELAEWCCTNKHLVRGKNVLELGSGVGMAGLAILKLCRPQKYIFTDCHPAVLEVLKENVDLNIKLKKLDAQSDPSLEDRLFKYTDYEFYGEIKIIDLPWENICDTNREELKVDLIVASDILFDNSTFKSLVSGLKHLLGRSNNFAIIAATVRNEITVQEFLDELDRQGLLYEDDLLYFKDKPEKIFIVLENIPIRILKIWRRNT